MPSKVGKSYNLRLYEEDWKAFFAYCEQDGKKPIEKLHSLILSAIGKSEYGKPKTGRPKKISLEGIAECSKNAEQIEEMNQEDWFEEMFN